ncbi:MULTISPECIES: SapC family protein [unclassified Aureimonas]|uniref:SapC family protein n=1 Tax=unclassified Aureimonas TaxID=2615206 RepID=UPI0006F9ABCA|nr:MULTISPECIES: SapC family protein [unclassified Aureimonas]KQT61263.1 hypothetical protein ASG54_24310 [Aureimonas sp. Leaf460]KQT68712.1 hypothetical protein ASG62_19070 [Aureimonas sp. Leaf427]
MSGLQPLSRFAAARCRAPDHYGFAGAMGWMPLNDTEYLLSAHHLPLSVRVLGGEPRLGVLMHPGYLARKLVDEAGRWRGGYMPIALRTFPFLLAKTAGPRPIDDLDVLVASRLLGETGVAICSDPESGQLGPELSAIRNTLLMMRTGGARLSRALDLLTIAGVLTPLRGMDDRSSGDFTVDPQRFGALDQGTIGALAHESFLALDLANALLFSRRHLSIDRLPQPAAEAPQRPGAAAPAPQADPMDFVLANLETMNFALDGSDLFDMTDMEGLGLLPEGPGEPLAQDEAATTVPERAVA